MVPCSCMAGRQRAMAPGAVLMTTAEVADMTPAAYPRSMYR
jgi:hypothetical protein